MKQIRRGVFETNSSSTHSICISKDEVNNLPSHISFTLGEYGWENDTVYDTAEYLYTALYYLYENEELDSRLKQIEYILNKHNVECTFKNPKDNSYYYIDHAGKLTNLINDLLNDEDKLLRYLFGASVIYTGNDNSNENTDICYAAEETIYDYDSQINYPNPNHDENKYEYYFKGN